MSGLRPRLLTLLSVAVLGCIATPFLLRDWSGDLASSVFRGLQGSGALGASAYLAVQFGVAATGILPASLLGVAAGAVYGFIGGSALSAVATLAGAVAGFHLGRRGLRNLTILPRRVRGGFARAEDFMLADGWKSVFLIRLSPVMPFAATSIALGASRVRERQYFIGTLASLPSLLGYVYAGSVLGGQDSLTAPEMRTVFAWALAIGAIAAVAVAARFVAFLNRARPAPDEPSRIVAREDALP